MLVDNHTCIHLIMLYLFEKGWKAVQSFRDINEPFGGGTISESRCREELARFTSGDTSLEYKPGRGRPVEGDKSLTAGMMIVVFNVDHSVIVLRLEKLGKWSPFLKDVIKRDASSLQKPQKKEGLCLASSFTRRITNEVHYKKAI
ncbi:HTH_48 domain-containing protein [Trichonephila clavipes]|nr:HTH_48 domain-containing protein [Trichonephila clavipes]